MTMSADPARTAARHRKLKWFYAAQIPPWVGLFFILSFADFVKSGTLYCVILAAAAMSVGHASCEQAAEARQATEDAAT